MGGLYSTGPDVLRFASALIDGPARVACHPGTDEDAKSRTRGRH